MIDEHKILNYKKKFLTSPNDCVAEWSKAVDSRFTGNFPRGFEKEGPTAITKSFLFFQNFFLLFFKIDSF